MSTSPEVGGRTLVLAAGSMLDLDAPTLVGVAASAGFHGVGLRLTGEQSVPTGRQADELRLLADDLGVVIHDAEVIRVDDTWRQTGHRVPDSALRLLEIAARLGATACLVVSDLPDVSATGDAVADLVEAASPLGLGIGVEYMAWTTPNTPIAALAMAEATGCLVVVDVLHHVRVRAGIEELRRLVEADRVAWVQLCDAATADAIDRVDFDRDDLIHEARHRRLVPGRGALPLSDLLAVVPTATVVSVEVQSDELAGLAAEDRARLLATATRALV